MEEIQTIISAKNAVDVLILAAVPNYRFGTFEFLGKSHPKRVEIPREFLSRGTAHPMSSGIFKLIQIDDTGAVFLRPYFIPGKNSLEIWNFQKINPLEKIKVGKGFVHEFWSWLRLDAARPSASLAQLRTHNIAPRIGMLLNGLFDPSRSPSPRFARSPFLDFFFPIPRPQEVACSQFPTIGGGR